ncbi:MAG: tetratricopeptide repeat protein [Rhodospirillaceae bacterium]|nr:tetratricopeptide repeat protein [Rhodospirillaceae bacterium]
MILIKKKLVEGAGYHRAGNFKGAEKLYKEALSLNPGERDALRMLSLLYSDTGKLKKALETIDQALKVDQGSALLHYTKGNLLLKALKTRGAKISYEQAIGIEPNFSEPRVNLGVLFREEGDLPAARQELVNALKCDAQGYEALGYLGVVIYELPMETRLDGVEADFLMRLVGELGAGHEGLLAIVGPAPLRFMGNIALRFSHNDMKVNYLAALEHIVAVNCQCDDDVRINAWAKYMQGSRDAGAAALSNMFNTMLREDFEKYIVREPTGILQKELPDVSGEWPLPSQRPVIYTAATPDYLSEFGLPFIKSVLQNSDGCDVHIHILNPIDQVFNPAKSLIGFPPDRVSWTCEVLGEQKKAVYASWRFMRLPELLENTNRLVVCLDIDSLVRNEVATAIELLSPFDALVYDTGPELCMSQLFKAGFVAVAPTPNGKRFSTIVASYISHFIERAEEKWFVDQFALLMSTNLLREEEGGVEIVSAPHNFLDWDGFADTSLIWTDKGDKPRSMPSVFN